MRILVFITMIFFPILLVSCAPGRGRVPLLEARGPLPEISVPNSSGSGSSYGYPTSGSNSTNSGSSESPNGYPTSGSSSTNSGSSGSSNGYNSNSSSSTGSSTGSNSNQTPSDSSSSQSSSTQQVKLPSVTDTNYAPTLYYARSASLPTNPDPTTILPNMLSAFKSNENLVLADALVFNGFLLGKECPISFEDLEPVLFDFGNQGFKKLIDHMMEENILESYKKLVADGYTDQIIVEGTTSYLNQERNKAIQVLELTIRPLMINPKNNADLLKIKSHILDKSYRVSLTTSLMDTSIAGYMIHEYGALYYRRELDGLKCIIQKNGGE